MNILGLDTALGACSVAVLANGIVLARDFRDMGRGHAEALAPMAAAAMCEAGLGFAALDRVAVTTGPGTFTGQRVGLAFARALGLALKKPVIGITTLDAMAQAACEESASAWAIAAADARREEIYLGARAKDNTVLAASLLGLTEAAETLATLAHAYGREPALAGTAAEMLLPLLRDKGFTPVLTGIRQPDAVHVARLGALGPAGTPPRPLYLRPPDAKLPDAKAAERR